MGRPAFGSLAALYRVGAPLRPASRLLARVPVPRRLPEAAALRDVAAADPTVAAAVFRGLLDEPPLPEDEATLAALTMPALVVGHRNDPLHALEDARDLARRLPDATLVEAPSIVTFRLRPEELATHVRRFLAKVPS